ncbi:MAG: hypothetical protein IPG58_16405 [Acidobacteria bacterium]|nr:hypothetical protein [Acidobacteriota bacterium]
MKRCPECRRDYYDDTLPYCLDDGNESCSKGRRRLRRAMNRRRRSCTRRRLGRGPTRAQINNGSDCDLADRNG